MAVKVFSCQTRGIEGKLVEVEADILPGLSAFQIVGLGDTAVQEAKERIRSAVKNSGAQYPQQKKVMNLAPAHVKKHGPHFDLPMAAGLLLASGQIPARTFEDALIMGELALDGAVRPVPGVLTMAVFAKKNGWKRIVIPAGNFEEASLVKGIEIMPVEKLSELIAGTHDFQSKSDAATRESVDMEDTAVSVASTKISSFSKSDIAAKSGDEEPTKANSGEPEVDFEDIIGNEQGKRALIIAAAGQHHLLFAGPPGVGKTMLARALAGILPPLSDEEMLEVLQIYSSANLFGSGSGNMRSRPFRAVHHTCSLLSLTGGGNALLPGEMSLAHRGVLFLDELPEFPRSHIEALRQPLEDRHMVISRANGTVAYPAHFTLVAGMNPCPCGYAGDPVKECICHPYKILQYQKKISGPILDRIDLYIEITRTPMSHDSLTKTRQKGTMTSAEVRKIIEETQKRQRERAKKEAKNQSIKPLDFSEQRIPANHHSLSRDVRDFLIEAGEKDHLSMRSQKKIIAVSHTIADLNDHNAIELTDIAEAFQYRRR